MSNFVLFDALRLFFFSKYVAFELHSVTLSVTSHMYIHVYLTYLTLHIVLDLGN